MTRGKTKTTRTYVNHADHVHPQTKAARVKCKRSIEETGQPWDGVDRDPVPGTPEFDALPRGRKSAIRRRHNEAMYERTEAVDTLLDASDRPAPLDGHSAPDFAPRTGEELTPDEANRVAGEDTLTGWRKAAGLSADSQLRDASGRFTQATLDRWQMLIDQLNESRSYIETNGIELLGASMATSVGGQRFVAEFDGDEWSVTAE